MSKKKDTTEQDLAKAIDAIADAKERIAAEEAVVSDFTEKAKSLMAEIGCTKATTDAGNTGTLVSATRLVFDEAKLKKSLGASMWNSLTKQVLDRSLLEANIAAGKVDANVVATATDEVQNKPYIKIGRGKYVPVSNLREQIADAKHTALPTKGRKKMTRGGT